MSGRGQQAWSAAWCAWRFPFPREPGAPGAKPPALAATPTRRRGFPGGGDVRRLRHVVLAEVAGAVPSAAPRPGSARIPVPPFPIKGFSWYSTSCYLGVGQRGGADDED